MLLELRRQISHIRFAEVGAQDALRRASLRDDVVAGQAIAQTFQLGGRGGHISFRRGFRQFDHDLFQRNQAGRGTVTLVAEVEDIDAAIDDDPYYTGGAYYYVQPADDDQE